MTAIYRIISTGNEIIADESFCERVHPGDWVYAREQVIDAPAQRRIKDWQFRNRFTQAQLVGIMRAAMDGDDLAALVWLQLATASDGVDLDNAGYAASLTTLAAAYPALAIDTAVILA